MAKQPQVLEAMFEDMDELNTMLAMFGYSFDISGLDQALVVENSKNNFLLFVEYNPTNKRDVAKMQLCSCSPKKSFDKFKELGGKESKATNNMFMRFESLDKMKDFIRTNLAAIIE